MRFIKGFFMALGMFCAIPLPFRSWHDECTDLMLPCYPLVGIVLGAIWLGLGQLLAVSGVSLMLAAAILAAAPFVLTGFLHLDGYMDTSDAILSRRPLEEKLRILKDSNAGAFSVIMLTLAALLQFAAVYSVLYSGGPLYLLAFIPILSRGCCAALLLLLKAMPQSGYANMMKKNTGAAHRAFPIIICAAAVLASCFIAGAAGLIVSAAVIFGAAFSMAYAYRQFGGASGDLAGFALVLGELCGLIALACV